MREKCKNPTNENENEKCEMGDSLCHVNCQQSTPFSLSALDEMRQ